MPTFTALRRTWRSVLAQVFTSRARRQRQTPASYRPRLESLEDRVTPTTILLTSNTQSQLASAITTAAADFASSPTTPVTIDFQPGPSTITLNSALPAINDGANTALLTINGTNQNITISGAGSFQIFNVAAGSQVSMSNLTLEQGFSSLGGGIFNAGTLTVTNCNLFGNVGLGTFSEGGGICSQGTLTVQGCTLSGNFAANGGGIKITSGTATVTNCTLSGNSATGSTFPGAGGAILNGGTLTVTNCTLSGNSARGGPNGGSGGGISNYHALTLLNSIVAGNASAVDPDVSGTVALADNNLIGNNQGLTIIAGLNNQQGTPASPLNPDLAPLGTNGGPTQTMALQSISPAIGQGGAITTVAASANGTTTTISVNNALAIAVTSGQYFILIDGEEMEVTGVDFISTPNTLTVVRAVNGVSATSISSGDPVYLFADQRGVARATPPDVGAFQFSRTGWSDVGVTVGSDGQARILWQNSGGQTALWSVNNSFTVSNPTAYPANGTFTAKATANDQLDNLTRVLLTASNGAMDLMLVNANNTVNSSHNFGQIANGWTAADVTASTVGSTNQTLILWVNVNGAIAIWSVDDLFNITSAVSFGYMSGWTTQHIAAGADGQTRLLWNNTNGATALWLLNASGTYESSTLFGAMSGWTAVDISVGSDNKARILWNNTNGTTAIWSVSNTFVISNTIAYGGSASGWTLVGLEAGADGLTRVLWIKTDGTAALWLVNSNNTFDTSSVYGPFG